MNKSLETAKKLYNLDGFDLCPAPGHEGGRNTVYICRRGGEPECVLRLSVLGDRDRNDFLAETEFVHYLAENGAPAADVLPSVNGSLVECVSSGEETVYAVLFTYAKGMLLYENGYRYREGAPLEEYFYNSGKALGAIHRLSKKFTPKHRRKAYFDKYNMAYIGSLIPDDYAKLKEAIAGRLEEFCRLPTDGENFGLVHFDYGDINYHIDMHTGEITVFDFDNCMYCWYMFDLANLWTMGIGWYRFEKDPAKRMEGMQHYFDTVLQGYRSETEVGQEMLERLPLFIDMVLIENVVDAFECSVNDGEEFDYEDIEYAAECLIGNIPYFGVGRQ